MKTLNAKVLSILKSQRYRTKDKPDHQTFVEFWRMRVSYPGPETVYEVELREPLRSLASKKYTVGLHGFVEFELFSNPQVAAGDSIQVDAYEPGERILGEAVLRVGLRCINSLCRVFRACLDLVIHRRYPESNPCHCLIDIRVKSASGRLLDSFYPSRGALSWQAPKADKNQSVGDLKLKGTHHSTNGKYRS